MCALYVHRCRAGTNTGHSKQQTVPQKTFFDCFYRVQLCLSYAWLHDLTISSNIPVYIIGHFYLDFPVVLQDVYLIYLNWH